MGRPRKYDDLEARNAARRERYKRKRLQDQDQDDNRDVISGQGYSQRQDKVNLTTEDKELEDGAAGVAELDNLFIQSDTMEGKDPLGNMNAQGTLPGLATTSAKLPGMSAKGQVMYKDKEAFEADMHQNISGIMDESLCLFQLDPREYHPFYLRIYKFITIGQEQGFITSSNDVNSYWEKYDEICNRMEKSERPSDLNSFAGEESPYATYIKTGRVVVNGKEVNLTRNQVEIDKMMTELEKSARDIVHRRNEIIQRDSYQIKDVRHDLSVRLEFFNICKSVTFPADCVGMNTIWRKFIHEFADDSDEISSSYPVPVQMENVVQEWSAAAPKVEVSHSNDNEDDLFEFEFMEPVAEYKVAPAVKFTTVDYTNLAPSLLEEKSARVLTSPTNELTEKIKPKLKSSNKIKQLRNKVMGRGNTSTSTDKKGAVTRLPFGTNRLSRLKKKLKPTTEKTPTELFQQQIKLEKLICSGRAGIKAKGKKTASNATVRNQKTIKEAESKPERIADIKLINKPTNSSLIYSSTHKIDASAASEVVAVKSEVKYKLDTTKLASEDDQNQLRKSTKGNGRGKGLKKAMCDECGQFFYSLYDVARHKRIIHNPSVSECPICHKGFSYGATLWAHFRREHTLEGAKLAEDDDNSNQGAPSKGKTDDQLRCVCELCGKFFAMPCQLKRHMAQTHDIGAKMFECPDCQKTFKGKDNMEAHRRQLHKGENYRCNMCFRVMQTAGKLWKHKVDAHGLASLKPPPGITVFKCEYCGEKFLRGLLQHVQKIHPEKVEDFKKKLIEVTISAKRESLDKRVLANQDEAKRLKRMQSKREIRRKWREEGIGPAWIRKESTPSKCPHCQMEMGSRQVWLKHLKQVHGTAMEDSYTNICSHPGCGKKFKKMSEVERHIRVAHIDLQKTLVEIEFVKRIPNNDPALSDWQCVICSKSLTNIEEILVHFFAKHQRTVDKIKGEGELTVSVIKSFSECPHRCAIKFDNDKMLRDHVEMDHPQLCWKCPECDWVVISPSDLQEHYMLEHSEPDRIAEWRSRMESGEPRPKKGKKTKSKCNKKTIKKRANSSVQAQSIGPKRKAGRPRKHVKSSEDDSDSSYIDCSKKGKSKLTSSLATKLPSRRSSRKSRS